MKKPAWLLIARLLGLAVAALLGGAGWALGQTPAPGGSGGSGPIGAARSQEFQRTAYGYFPTRWRQWPCDRRIDQHFPTAVGKEHLPRPTGRPLQPQRPGVLPVPEGLLQPGPGGPITLPSEPKLPGEPSPEAIPGATPGKPASELPGEGLELPAEPQLPDVTKPAESPLPGLPGGKLPGEPIEGPGVAPPESLLPGEPTPGSGTDSQMQPGSQNVEPLLPEVPLTPDAGARSLMRRPAGSPPSETRASLAAETTLSQPPLFKKKDARAPIYRPSVSVPSAPTQRHRSRAQEPPIGPSEVGTIQADWQTVLQTTDRAHRTGISGRPGGAMLAWHRAEPIATQQADVHPVVPSSLPVALDGYCPVELVKNERWVRGDPRWAIDYQGRRYLLSSQVQREAFLVNPQRYVPAYDGNDPVLMVDRNQHTPGSTQYCVTYDGRLYMFSSPATLAHFRQHPERYALEP